MVTCAPDAGAASLSRFPTSVVEEYRPGRSERAYTYGILKRNRQEDELLSMRSENNIADVELDSTGSSVVATLLNPEHDGQEHAAVVFELATGRQVCKLVEDKPSSRICGTVLVLRPTSGAVVATATAPARQYCTMACSGTYARAK